MLAWTIDLVESVVDRAYSNIGLPYLMGLWLRDVGCPYRPGLVRNCRLAVAIYVTITGARGPVATLPGAGQHLSQKGNMSAVRRPYRAFIGSTGMRNRHGT